MVLLGFESSIYSQDSLLHRSVSAKDLPQLTVKDSSLSKDSLNIVNKKGVNANDSTKSDTLVEKKKEGLEASVTYSSTDSIRIGVKSKMINLYGEGEIDYQDLVLKSQNVELDMDKREVYARGKVDSVGKYKGRPNFKQGSEVFDSDTLKYNFTTKKGLVYGLLTKQEEGYLHSTKTKILPDKEVQVQSGKFTTCDQEHPHFYVALTKAIVIPNDKIITGPAYLVVEDVPIPVPIPFGFFPNKKGSTSGILLPTFGSDPTRGYYFKDAGYYWSMNRYVDVILKGDIYTLGSWRTSFMSNYKVNYLFSGDFSFEYASIMVNESPATPTIKLIWNHHQAKEATKNGTFSASVNYQSSGHSKNNAQTSEDFLKPSIGSSINYSRTMFKVINLNISGTHTQNLIDSIASFSLPNVSLSANSLTPFKRNNAVGKTRWYEDIRVGYSLDAQNKLSNVKMDSTFFTKRTLSKFQMGLEHKIPISTSIKLFKYFTITPSFNYTERVLFDKITQRWSDSVNVKGVSTKGAVVQDTMKGIYRVWDYSLSTSIGTNIYGMYLFKNKVIKALRHKMTPSIAYTFTPDFGKSSYGYYSSYIDQSGKKIYYSYFGSSIYGTPANGKQSSLSFSLSNSLELKVRNRKDTVTYIKKIALIENLSISASYNFAADSMRWSEITLTGTTNLMKRISIQYSAYYDPYRVIRSQYDYNNIQRVNRFVYDSYGRLWRMDNSLLNVTTNFQLGPQNTNPTIKTSSRKTEQQFSDFSLPWTLNISYTWSLPRRYYIDSQSKLDSVTSKITQTIGFNGTINVTKNWKVGYATGWDFMANKIAYTKLDFFRNLHCWDMSFLWIPFGGMQRYEFTVKVKAGMLKDLKVDKKKSYGSPY